MKPPDFSPQAEAPGWAVPPCQLFSCPPKHVPNSGSGAQEKQRRWGCFSCHRAADWEEETVILQDLLSSPFSYVFSTLEVGTRAGRWVHLQDDV